MLWLIEPHADDVFLSLHQHLVSQWKNEDRTIVTVYCSKRRAKEAGAYAKSIGCNHVPIGCVEGGVMNGTAGKILSISKWGVDFKRDDTVLLPLGIQHPEHIAVHDLAGAIFGMCKSTIKYYLDTPYYTKLKLADELLEKTKGKTISSMAWAGNRKWRHIDKFKSQSKFFYFNPPDKLPRLEIVLS